MIRKNAAYRAIYCTRNILNRHCFFVHSVFNSGMKRDHTELRVLMPTLHYPPVVGGLEVFMQNIAERVGQTVDFYVITGSVAGAPRKESKERLHVIRNSSLYPLRDLAYS